jgi:hypothetical protein
MADFRALLMGGQIMGSFLLSNKKYLPLRKGEGIGSYLHGENS